MLTIKVLGQAPYNVKLEKAPMTVGRRPDNDVVIAQQYVSGHHGRFELIDGQWFYVDLNSTNGTYYNGRLVNRTLLKSGDILRVGDLQGNSVSLTFQSAVAQDPAVAASPSTIRMGTTTLAQPTVLIGRDSQSDVPLTAPVVSWHHARIEQTPQGHIIIDLGSTNGTFINGQRIQGRQPLKKGDVVRIGPFKLVYEATGALVHYDQTGGVRLDGAHLVREVELKKNKKKRILDDISISVYPKEFISLVGTSGAGKSTLMKALSGVNRADGRVLVNGDDLYKQFDVYRTMIGYVPQDDILHGDLMVADALRYAAELRLPADTTPAERDQRIQEVLQQVEMSGHETTVIKRLSGGQRKRISIATELLADPQLFFLDEPTSGLDPGLEKKMMYTLRKLADGGRTIVLVTHATANINQCDHVCFLSHGHMVYYGPPSEAKNFFGVTSDDFADIYERIDDPDWKVAKEKAEVLDQQYRSSKYHENYVAERQRTLSTQPPVPSTKESGPKVNGFRQFGILTRRYFNLVLRDKTLRLILLLIMPILGILLRIIADPYSLRGMSEARIDSELTCLIECPESYEGQCRDNPGRALQNCPPDESAEAKQATYMIATKSQTVLFMMSLAAVLLGLFAAALEIVKEESIYKRERLVSLRILPYLASKVVVLGTFAVFQVLLLLLVIGVIPLPIPKVDLPASGILLPSLVEMYVTLLMALLAAIMIGLFVSAFVSGDKINISIYILVIVLFLQILLSGAFFQLKGPMLTASNLTLTRWSMEGLGATANLEAINANSETWIRPEPITQEVSMEVEKPEEGWEPVTIVTATRLCQVGPQTDPEPVVIVTEFEEHEMVTVTETVTETVTISDADPVIVSSKREFDVSYASTTGHLLKVWGILAGFSLLFTLLTIWALKSKDVV